MLLNNKIALTSSLIDRYFSPRIFQESNNPLTEIVASIASFQNRAQFYTAQDSAEGLATSFSRYLHQFEITAFFAKNQLEHIRQSVASNDYNQLIGQIVNLWRADSTLA